MSLDRFCGLLKPEGTVGSGVWNPDLQFGEDIVAVTVRHRRRGDAGTSIRDLDAPETAAPVVSITVPYTAA